MGGDPAELMRICVENGTFTVAFLKEGMAKVCFFTFTILNVLTVYLQFRGWIDDLLKTSWEACQGTDVLVESPSAMGGIHIAEALRIPYFRAFTMTWSRTRAYPHAFAVPEHKVSPLSFVYDILLTVSIQDGRELQLHGTIAFIL